MQINKKKGYLRILKENFNVAKSKQFLFKIQVVFVDFF